jgi:chaperone modulatory protein CbpM
MTDRAAENSSGTLFDEATEISIVDLCDACSIDITVIEEMIAEGIVEPSGRELNRVPYSTVRRTRTVIHLQHDLGVNLAGAALALELLEQIAQLRAKLRLVETGSDR